MDICLWWLIEDALSWLSHRSSCLLLYWLFSGGSCRRSSNEMWSSRHLGCSFIHFVEIHILEQFYPIRPISNVSAEHQSNITAQFSIVIFRKAFEVGLDSIEADL